MARIEEEVNEPTPDHFYMAQLASAIECLPYRVWGKMPPTELRDIKNFMLKFGDPDQLKERADQISEERKKQDAEYRQDVWLGFLGFDRDYNYVGNGTEGRKRDLPPHVTHFDQSMTHPQPGQQTEVVGKTVSPPRKVSVKNRNRK